MPTSMIAGIWRLSAAVSEEHDEGTGEPSHRSTLTHGWLRDLAEWRRRTVEDMQEHRTFSSQGTTSSDDSWGSWPKRPGWWLRDGASLSMQLRTAARAPS